MNKGEVAILDFGSSKITILVGAKGVNGTFKIIASGVCEYAGFMKGEFLEPENLSSAISYAKNQAENALGRKIKNLYVGVPTEFCCSTLEKISLNLNKRIRIKQKNIDKLFNNSSITYENYEIINKTPLYFLLDDGNRILNPIGCITSNITVLASYVLVSKQFYDFIDTVFCEVGIYTIQLISSALAESLYLIDPELRQNGALLVDCGFITTSVNSIMFEGISDLKSFSLGGGYITSDLMEVLKIPFESAEELKRKVILSIQPFENECYEIMINHQLRKFPIKIVNEICLARIDLISEGILKCLNSFTNKVSSDMVIYLTGGGLNYIKGVVPYIEQIVQRKVELIAPQPLQFNKPELSSPLSLVDAATNM